MWNVFARTTFLTDMYQSTSISISTKLNNYQSYNIRLITTLTMDIKDYFLSPYSFRSYFPLVHGFWSGTTAVVQRRNPTRNHNSATCWRRWNLHKINKTGESAYFVLEVITSLCHHFRTRYVRLDKNPGSFHHHFHSVVRHHRVRSQRKPGTKWAAADQHHAASLHWIRWILTQWLQNQNILWLPRG